MIRDKDNRLYVEVVLQIKQLLLAKGLCEGEKKKRKNERKSGSTLLVWKTTHSVRCDARMPILQKDEGG